MGFGRHGGGEHASGHANAAAAQPLREQVPGAAQAAGDRAFRKAEQCRHLATRAVLHVAQHEHLGEGPRQAVEFGIEDRADVVGHWFGTGFARQNAALVFVPPGRTLQGFP
ncbi:MAG: hypothetical protein U0791_00580 [Gemmataceae bacterium]